MMRAPTTGSPKPVVVTTHRHGGTELTRVFTQVQALGNQVGVDAEIKSGD